MRSGFFNSEIIGYDAENMPVFDRAEEASFFAKYFSQFISNGVFPNPSTNMQVLATEGMQVKVSIGVCYINGYMGWVEPEEILEIEESDTRARIDRIVAKLDFTDRSIKLMIKKGVSSGNPVAPDLQRDYDCYEIGLADIKVNANVVEILQENITDLRLNTALCGVVANHLQHIDTSSLFHQYQDWLNRVTNEAETDLAERKQEMETSFNNLIIGFSKNFDTFVSNCSNHFNDWFQDVQTTLSGDVGGNLLVKINHLQEDVNTKYNQINERIGMLEKRIYGVRRNIETPDTTWERIEDSIGLTANATHDGTGVHNDFDNIYPWSDIISCDVSADGTINSYYGDPDFSFTNPQGYIMTLFPEFYWKRTQENGYEYIYISPTRQEGFKKSEPFMLSRYMVAKSETELYSKSGTELFSDSSSNLRTYVKQIGEDWNCLDITRWSILQLLYLVEYADYYIQKVLGHGFKSSTSGYLNSGSCDVLGMKSGCVVDSEEGAVIYRGIENIFGNSNQFCDGINKEETELWISRNPNHYTSGSEFKDSYDKLSYKTITMSGNVSKVGYDRNNPEIQLPIALGGSASKYISSWYRGNMYKSVILVGGNGSISNGIWYYECRESSFSSCIRLLYLPEKGDGNQ